MRLVLHGEPRILISEGILRCNIYTKERIAHCLSRKSVRIRRSKVSTVKSGPTTGRLTKNTFLRNWYEIVTEYQKY